MVTRIWDYDPKPGKCTEDKVHIRVLPSLKMESVGSLNKDDSVEILTRTEEKMQVEKWNNYWYKVRTTDGKIGWVFGEFIKSL